MPLKGEALKAYKKRYYEENKGAILAKCRDYAQANKDKILARQKAWNERNAEKQAAYKRAWKERNPEHRLEYAARPEVKAHQQAKSRAYYAANKDKVLEQTKAWREANPERKRFADWSGHLRRKYGITPEQYSAMLAEQGGKCSICGRVEADSVRGVLVVDHMHCSGKVRSLLCAQCNSGIGLLGENPETLRRAIEYIERHKTH